MHNRILAILVSLVILTTAGCGFHLRGTTEIPMLFQTIVLDSSDPYGPLTRAIRKELRLNNIQIESNSARTDIPSLRILGLNEEKKTISVYRSGATAEHQIALTLHAQVLFPNQDLYPLTVKVFRTFFDNPRAALAKDAEQDMIDQEMLEQAAQQLMRKLLAITSTEAVIPD